LPNIRSPGPDEADRSTKSYGMSWPFPALWDAKMGMARRTLKGHSGSVSAVAFTLDGQLFAKTGAAQRTLEGHSGRVSAGRPASCVGLRRRDGQALGCEDRRSAALAWRAFRAGQRRRILARQPASRVDLGGQDSQALATISKVWWC
jgi:hypothetical protein